jgi:hypothetical protein
MKASSVSASINRGHPVTGQWVFGGVEREFGGAFFVPVPDTSAETLVAVIRDWIEPGTTVISDCWGAYFNLEEEGYSRLTVNHSIGFVDPHTGAHTNTIECQWRQLKAYLHPYNRRTDYVYQLVRNQYAAICKAQNIDQFIKFLHIVATTDWSNFPTSSAPHCSDSAPSPSTSSS